MTTRRSALLISIMCGSMLAVTTCRRPTAADYLASLPDLPADLVSTLDPATMATKVASTFPDPVLETPPALAPCCGSTDVKKLQVNYSHTKCAPLRDFVVAEIDDVWALFRGRPESRAYRLREFNGTVLDQVICMTSSGPWNATLTEQRSCVGYAPVQSLVIDAYGDLVLFSWNGGTENHPPGIGLVSCRQVGTTRFKCNAQSSCECLSSACPLTDPCQCSPQW